MELKSLSHTHTQLLVDALTTLGLLRCYGLEFGSPKQGLGDRIQLLLFWLAVADLLNLTCQLLMTGACYLQGDPGLLQSWTVIASTKVNYTATWTNSVAGGLILIMSVDRFFTVAFPFRARSLLTFSGN
ncbi:hypothetical protein ACOMHN_008878 [Nucella lapillus]